MAQWLRLHALNAGCLGSIPDQGTKIPYATTKTWYNQVNSLNKLKIIYKKVKEIMLENEADV